ncbi:MAG: Flp family type IVb pilin [Acidobacteriota bacterium]
MKQKAKKLWSFFTDESGQGMVEYILIIGLIVLFIVLVLMFFREAINKFINKVIGWINGQKVPSTGP